jgi:phage-related minor tail protein
VSGNVVNIDITSTDKAALAQFAKNAKLYGKQIEEGLGQGFDAAERKAKESGEKITKPMKESATKIDKSFDMTARQVGRYLYQIERQAWASGEGMDGAFSEASRKIRADLDKIRTTAAKTGEGLESELGNALKAVSQQANKLGETIKPPGGGSKGGGLIDSLIGDIPKGAAAAGALGLAVGKAAWEGLQAEWAEDKVGGLLAAQTGAASSAAEGLGNTAGDIFTDNFGESVEEVGAAMKSVFENKLIDTGAAQKDVEAVTEKVMTLSQVTGEEFDKISYSASRMVKTGIAGSVSEAFDLIGKAQENGLNAAGDLLDTLTEYDTKFRDLGLNGAEALGLIQQSMEGGARNTDVAADALKEFSIRAQDMSVLTKRGFETIGLDADVMGQRIAKGGQSAHDALQDTLNALEAMPPGVARNSAAVDLFGTKAEDLGKALYDMDLDDAAKKFGEFGGTVDEQMKKINDSANFWDKLGKGIGKATGALGEWLDKQTDVDIPEELKGTLEEINKAQKDFDSSGNTKALDALKQKYPEAAEAIDAYIKKKNDEKAANDSAAESTEEYITTIDKLIAKQREASEGVLSLSEAQISHEQAIDAADQALIDNGKTLDITTQKGRDNQSALNDLASTTYDVIEAMRAQGATTQEVQNYMAGSRQSFVDHAIAMGMDATQANILADNLGMIPGNYNAKVIVDNGQALHAFQAVQNAISGIPRNINVAITQTLKAFGKETGGITSGATWGAATGGQRHSSTMVNEAGPELISLPDGSDVMTAGATRAMGEAGLLGGGGGGATQVVVSMDGADALAKALLRALRFEIKNSYGGSSNAAFNQRGVG